MKRVPPEAGALFLIVLAAVLSAVVVSAATASSHPQVSALQPTATPATSAVGARVVKGPLDGQPTRRDVVERRPIAVMVGNLYPSARPQAGLTNASLVFETLVEGGITRLMPVYLEHDAADVGPVRSARPYFVKWAAGLGALFVHAGGSPQSLRLISHTALVGDIEALSSEPEFHRDANRTSPDNLFGSTTGVRAIAQRKAINQSSPVIGFSHKARSAAPKQNRVGHLRIQFSTSEIASPDEYAVEYRFDAARGVYARSVGGVPAIDRSANRQLSANNVVVLYTAIKLIPNDPLARVSVRAIGDGRAIVFRNGRVERGTWSKTSAASPLKLLDARGSPIPLDPGLTWVEVTSPGDATWSRK